MRNGLLPALGLAIFALFSTATGHAEPGDQLKEKPMNPKVIFFDVNETLLDLEGMRSSVAAALGGRDDLLPLWFSTMLHHSLVETATGRFHPFGEVGVAALMMVAAHGWDIAGIKASGMQGVFLARPGKALYPLAIPPDFTVKDLGELAEAMRERQD